MTPQPHNTENEPRKPRRTNLFKFNKKTAPWLIIVILACLSLFLFDQYHDAKAKLQSGNTTLANSQQASALLAKIAKIAVLPANETPTIATVANVSKLKGQSFFANAQNGDKVLVFSREKEAILYRPSTNQIVNIAPVSVSSSGSGQ
jgi:uncharacterized membrane protein